jgi:uncharacterized protein (DUF2147 family)
MKQIVCLSFLLCCFYNNVFSQNRSSDIVGTWLTSGKNPGKIQIYQAGDKYFGKITWLQVPHDPAGKPKVDTKNPDEKNRTQPLLNLVILKDFTFNGKDEWSNGHIYDPSGGKTYNCYIKLKDWNTMKVRGFIGVSLLGRTETWTRVN